MTACAYISPKYEDRPDSPVLPIIIADTLKTFTGKLITDKTMLVTPANFSGLNATYPAATVGRKIIIASDKLAFACAGNLDRIRTFSRELLNVLPELAESPRPMRRVGDAANAYGIETVGAGITPTLLNSVRYRTAAPGPFIGECGFAGSGGHDLVNRLKNGEQQYLSKFSYTPPFVTAGQIINSVITQRYVEELFSETKNYWGGYLEWVYHDGKIWQFGPSALHFYSIFVKDDE